MQLLSYSKTYFAFLFPVLIREFFPYNFEIFSRINTGIFLVEWIFSNTDSKCSGCWVTDDPAYGVVMSPFEEKDILSPEPWMKDIGVHGILPPGLSLAIISGAHRAIALGNLYKQSVLFLIVPQTLMVLIFQY